MADPRLASPFEMTEHGPRPRAANLSPLMRAKGKAHQGEKVNFCPFGCDDSGLDENGYCRHLVGFTNDGKGYEPLVRRKGRRVVCVKREMIESGRGEDGEKEYEWGPPQPEAIRKSDKLVPITVSARVYRDVDKEAAKAS